MVVAREEGRGCRGGIWGHRVQVRTGIETGVGAEVRRARDSHLKEHEGAWNQHDMVVLWIPVSNVTVRSSGSPSPEGQKEKGYF